MTEKRVELKKALNPIDVWALALGSIIGFGCFVLPGDWLPKAGPLGAAIAFLLGGLLMLIIANSYSVMIKNFPVAGGEFAYAYGAFGRYHAYICGWFLALGYLSIIPANGTALAVLGRFVAPGLFEWGYLYTVAGWEVYLGEIMLATFAMLFFFYLHYKGVGAAGKMQSLIVVLLVAAVLLLGGGALLNPVTSTANLQPLFAPGKSAIACIAALLAIAPFLFVGFDTIPQAAEEFNFSHDKTKKLMYLAIIIGAVDYATETLSTAMAEPWQDLNAGKPVWASGQAMYKTMGNLGVVFLMVGVLMAITSGINGFFMATSRLLFGMGRAKVLPNWFTDIHPKYSTPYKALIFVLIISLVAPWFGRKAIIWIVDMCAVGTAIGYMYTCMACYLLSKNNSSMPGAAMGKVKGLVGTLCAILFLGLLLIPGSPAFLTLPCWIALACWLAIGLYFYLTIVKDYKQLSEEQLDHYILGDFHNIIKKPLVADSYQNRPTANEKISG